MNISVVVPVYNEEENIGPLYFHLRKALDNSGGLVNDYEIIFVDDGSSDESHLKIGSLGRNRLKTIRFKRNMGKSAALSAGFQKAGYEIIATIDADLQYDPRDILGMAEKVAAGYDCVCGWRHIRRDAPIKKLSAKISNYVRRLILKDNFHDIGCALRVFKSSCIQGMEFFHGSHRFLPFLIEMAGHKVLEYKIRHYPRICGKSKYNIRNRLLGTMLNLIYVIKIKRQRKKPDDS
ncbi:MAG: glycosyltransferase family 2 protein [Candidatus Omnitrophica bacterium]|nr:glycosyltransferase family 2 protein [Candidatus Omnitrophota bacterium]